MRPAIKEHIQQLDVKLGGGIVSEKIRVNTINNPMLVIGIGGTGNDALLRLKYQINRRFRLPEDPITRRKKEKPDNIEFLAFETNQRDAGNKYKGIKLDSINELVLLSNAEIGGILQNRSVLDPCISEWLSPELIITDGMNGANGVRQAGRLLLFTKIMPVIKSIEKKIDVLLKGTSEKLMVFILSGLSGGTGSGCFLDIAYIVRGLMEKKYGTAGVDRVNILGYLFTPDINLDRIGNNSHTCDYVIKNGYAALKELDYWMNVDERGERFKQNYRDILTVDSPMPPFNLCHLISATNTEGKLLDNAYDYCLNVTAENITNFMADEEKHSGEEFAIHDYISNINTNIAQMARPYSANYKYNIIGASSADLPIEEITTYLAYRLFKKMEKMFKNAPNQQDVEEFVRSLKLDKEFVARRFQQNVPEPLVGYNHSERLSHYNIVKTRSVNIDFELQGFLEKAREEYIKAKRQLPGEYLAEFNDQVRRIFLNADQGPFYASRLIFSTSGFCLLKTIEAYIESLKEMLKRYPQDIESLRYNADEKMAEAMKAIINKEKKKNDYIEAKINEYYLRADEERIKQMMEFFQDVHSLLNSENSRIYNVFTEVLNTLNQIFEENGNILVTGKETEYKENRTYHWNIVSIPDVLKTIDEVMDEKDEDDLIRFFTKELLGKSANWVREQDIDIIGSISDFMSDSFGDLITKSMEEFLVIKYGNDEMIDKLIERNIAKRLDDDAVPVFYLSNSSGNLNLPSWGFVSIPQKAPEILKGINNYKTNALGKSNFTVKESEVKNRIFWLNTKNGVPLYAYSPLKIYEEAYEKTILEKEGIGRHLVQTRENNWTYLPSPIPQRSWGDTYYNNRVKGYNQELAQVFEKALKQGCIREKDGSDGSNNRYNYIVTKPFKLQPFLAKFEMQLPSGQMNFSEMKRCLLALKSLVEDGIERDYSKDLFDSYNKERAMENFARSPQAIKLVKAELNKYDEILLKIQELDSALKAVEKENTMLEQFIEAMYTGTIFKKGAMYVYDKEPEEEEWEPFVNLLKVKKYPEFEIYSKFCSLDEKHKGQVLRKSEKRSKELGALEDTTQLLNTINGMIAAYAESREELGYSRDELINGNEMYDFYKKVLTKLNDLKRNLQ
ncbi:hypothetical protein OXPF_27500 [Oxobacter pfennigii]|uniref:Tubulin like n=1 Tax=Oxobacter pfennigii TaxID=36849 RepID=A0A0P8W6F3_9CLOT|nr:tubulin-like doman-containing protein [Oxobacter pfennigii]KPU43309.1 hypothetical protein OXPF_27500 [Oxobacter pfennigii]